MSEPVIRKRNEMKQAIAFEIVYNQIVANVSSVEIFENELGQVVESTFVVADSLDNKRYAILNMKKDSVQVYNRAFEMRGYIPAIARDYSYDISVDER